MIAQAAPEISRTNYNLNILIRRSGPPDMELLKADATTQFFGDRHSSRMVSVLQGITEGIEGGTA